MEVIQRAHILISNLKKGWDGKDSLPCKKHTWKKAVNFVLEFDPEIDFPRITLLANGSIDIHWKTKEYELLVNIPKRQEPFEYYGDNRKEKFVIKGACDESNSYLVPLLNFWIRRFPIRVE